MRSVSNTKIEINHPMAVAAACLLSAVGALVYNIMPIFLGSMATWFSFNDQALGLIAAAYLAGFTVTSFSAVFWSRRLSWHKALVAGVAIALAGYGGCLLTDVFALILFWMFMVGLAKGIFFAVSLCSLADTALPDRAFALAVMTQICLAALGLFLLSRVSRTSGFGGVLVALIGVTALMVVLLKWLPVQGRKTIIAVSESTTGSRLPVYAGLAGTLLLMTGMSGVWAFLERIGDASGLPAHTVGTALSICLLVGALAALTAAWLGDRVGRAGPILFGTLIMLCGILCLGGRGNPLWFSTAAMLLMGGWTFAFPFQMAAVSSADADGRFVSLIAAAQGLGAALGPGLAGSLVVNGGYSGVYATCAGCLITSLGIFQWLVFNTGCRAESRPA